MKILFYLTLLLCAINFIECKKQKLSKYPLSWHGLISSRSKLEALPKHSMWSYWEVKLGAHTKYRRKSRSPTYDSGLEYDEPTDNPDNGFDLYENNKYPQSLTGLFGSSFFYNPANALYCYRGSKKHPFHRRQYKPLDYDYNGLFNTGWGHISKPPPEFRG